MPKAEGNNRSALQPTNAACSRVCLLLAGMGLLNKHGVRTGSLLARVGSEKEVANPRTVIGLC